MKSRIKRAYWTFWWRSRNQKPTENLILYVQTCSEAKFFLFRGKFLVFGFRPMPSGCSRYLVLLNMIDYRTAREPQDIAGMLIYRRVWCGRFPNWVFPLARRTSKGRRKLSPSLTEGFIIFYKLTVS